MKLQTLFDPIAFSGRLFFTVSAAVLFAGCGQTSPQEVAVPWDNFASSGWYAVDPKEYGDCAAGMEQIGEAEATQLRLAFNMQGVNFATYRNHELAVADWTPRRALVVDVENKAAIPLGICLFLSNDDEGPTWHQSMRHPLTAGSTRIVRFGLRPVPQKGPPKDWTEDAWQFAKLDLSNINRIAIRLYAPEGAEGVEGEVIVSNPRVMKLAEVK